jgi:hypothetical protein
MQSYFFHLRNGKDVLLDAEGRMLEIADVDAAALKEARAIIASDINDGTIDLDQGIEVQDRSGEVVNRTAFRDAVHITLGGRRLY